MPSDRDGGDQLTAAAQVFGIYPRALDCGIAPSEFWQLSVMEIFDLMESCNRRREQETKEKLSMLFVLAQSTAEHIGLYLNNENKARLPWDFYPKLFAAEKEEYQKAQYADALEKAKENRRAYAAEIKRRRDSGLM